MSFTIKFPLKINIEELKRRIKQVERRGKLKGKPFITVTKKGNWGEIRAKTWEDIVLAHTPVSIALDEVFDWKTIDDETGERIDSRILDTLWTYVLKDGVHNLTRQRLMSECKPYKSSMGGLTPNKTSRKKGRGEK